MDRRTFRANPRYELVLADRLADAERQVIRDLGDDIYGVLRPQRGSGLETRSCSPDTALLFLTLAEPGPLPTFARTSLGEDGERVLARLVIDGVLEISTADGFRSGPAAADLVLPGRSEAGQGRISELSTAALRYGQALAGLSADVLASRLYRYGCRPVSPELRQRMPDDGAVERHIGIAPGAAAARTLDTRWNEKPDEPGRRSPWRFWAPNSGRPEMRGPGRQPSAYKLYVSPSVDAVPVAVAAVAGSLADAPGVNGFKIARSLPGLCRPDKLVVYFDRLDDLRLGAARLTAEMDGVAAQGVPFSAAVTLDGLLSWGADPPLGLAAPMSWRTWVAERLAEYLVMARGRDGGAGMEPWQIALHRLRLAGIDTDTWVPRSGMWRTALAMS